MTDLFGDIELEDVWDADPTIEALQVAIRLHDLRSALDALAVGRAARQWADVPRRDRDYLLIVADSIVDHIVDRQSDDPVVLARAVHEDGSLTNWDDLADDDQQIAIDLLAAIVRWLEHEGPR